MNEESILLFYDSLLGQPTLCFTFAQSPFKKQFRIYLHFVWFFYIEHTEREIRRDSENIGRFILEL